MVSNTIIVESSAAILHVAMLVATMLICNVCIHAVPVTPSRSDVCAVYDAVMRTLQIVESTWNKVVCSVWFDHDCHNQHVITVCDSNKFNTKLWSVLLLEVCLPYFYILITVFTTVLLYTIWFLNEWEAECMVILNQLVNYYKKNSCWQFLALV